MIATFFCARTLNKRRDMMSNPITFKRWTLAICIVVSTSIIALIGVLHFDALGVFAGQPITIPNLAANAVMPPVRLTATSNPQQVIALMLNSHTRWRTLQAKGISMIVADLRTNTLQTDYREIQIEQYGRVRAQSGPLDQPPTFTWISDGNIMWAEDLIRGTYTEEPVPESVRSLETYGPPMPPPDGQAFVVRHPLDGIIGSALAEYVFPHGLAQSFSRGELDVVGTDRVAERDTVVVLWQVRKNGALGKKHKYWIDARTGVILKGEGYAEIPGWDRWVEQTVVGNIIYDQPISPEAFTFQPAPGAKRIEPSPP
jgi:hypothetical protein